MKEDFKTTYERNFDTLLFDSLNMLFKCLNIENGYDFCKTLSRGSMIFSILLLETAANTCLETLEFEKSIAKEIDRLPVLSKFDIYLRTKFRNKKLDRGIAEVQVIQELKNLRDGFVHMKPHKMEWEINGDEGTSTFQTTNHLKIPKNANGWEPDSAVITAKAVHDFLKYFFKVKCRYSSKMVSSLLFSEEKVPNKEFLRMPLFYKETKRTLLEIGIDISYMKLAWT